MPYRIGIALRNTYYSSAAWSRHRAPCPVISIGNITVGGTGKTPMAIHVTNLLAERGRKVAILLRGYKGQVSQSGIHDIESDEALLLQRRCSQAEIVANPDRIAGAAKAVASGHDTLVLDDGFQHRRLARDLDIVLVDATAPFGFGRLLPRGLLREPARSLRRADVIVLTRSDQIEDSDRSLLIARLKRESGLTDIVCSSHRLVGFTDVSGADVSVEDPTAMQAVIFAGIGNFESFRHSVERLGIGILAAYEYPDHHDYTGEEIRALSDVAGSIEANVILTTEKDAVKLAGRWQDDDCRLLVPNLKIEFDPEGDRILEREIDKVISRQL